MDNSTSYFSQTSLYVGNLHPSISEGALYQAFSYFGYIVSVRLLRDKITKRSLGYAYVNFYNREQAEDAIKQHNYTIMFGRPIRIMWNHRDPSFRRNKDTNLFVTNIDPQVTTRDLYNVFSMFGPIYSCKLSFFSNGIPRGYGFVQFENKESADEAMEKMNGVFYLRKHVLFINKMKSELESTKINLVENYLNDWFSGNFNFRNLYVKNIPKTFSELDFIGLFMVFGRITRSKLMLNKFGISKCCGFICFLEKHCALNAIKELHDKVLDGQTKPLHVCYAEKKAERLEKLRKIYNSDPDDKEALKTNIYVNNLSVDVDRKTVQEIFEPFGNITSFILLKKNYMNTGQALVNFSCHEYAKNAVESMDGKIIDNKTLSVSYALTKEERERNIALEKIQKIIDQKISQKPNMIENTPLDPNAESNDLPQNDSNVDLSISEQSIEEKTSIIESDTDDGQVEIVIGDISTAGPSKHTEPNSVIHKSHPRSKYPPIHYISDKVAKINEKWAGKVTRIILIDKKPILEELLLDDDKFRAEVLAIVQELESNSVEN